MCARVTQVDEQLRFKVRALQTQLQCMAVMLRLCDSVLHACATGMWEPMLSVLTASGLDHARSNFVVAVRGAVYPMLPDDVGLAVHVLRSHLHASPAALTGSVLQGLLSDVGHSEECCLAHYASLDASVDGCVGEVYQRYFQAATPLLRTLIGSSPDASSPSRPESPDAPAQPTSPASTIPWGSPQPVPMETDAAELDDLYKLDPIRFQRMIEWDLPTLELGMSYREARAASISAELRQALMESWPVALRVLVDAGLQNASQLIVLIEALYPAATHTVVPSGRCVELKRLAQRWYELQRHGALQSAGQEALAADITARVVLHECRGSATRAELRGDGVGDVETRRRFNTLLYGVSAQLRRFERRLVPPPLGRLGTVLANGQLGIKSILETLSMTVGMTCKFDFHRRERKEIASTANERRGKQLVFTFYARGDRVQLVEDNVDENGKFNKTAHWMVGLATRALAPPPPPDGRSAYSREPRRELAQLCEGMFWIEAADETAICTWTLRLDDGVASWVRAPARQDLPAASDSAMSALGTLKKVPDRLRRDARSDAAAIGRTSEVRCDSNRALHCRSHPLTLCVHLTGESVGTHLPPSTVGRWTGDVRVAGCGMR